MKVLLLILAVLAALAVLMSYYWKSTPRESDMALLFYAVSPKKERVVYVVVMRDTKNIEMTEVGGLDPEKKYWDATFAFHPTSTWSKTKFHDARIPLGVDGIVRVEGDVAPAPEIVKGEMKQFGTLRFYDGNDELLITLEAWGAGYGIGGGESWSDEVKRVKMAAGSAMTEEDR